jgi:pimeloyl-ACP methyl ester carboxylesterase
MEIAKKSDLGFVFLHGAGLGAWIWDDLTQKLEYPFLAIDLPGRGKHINVATKGLSLDNYVESTLSDIDQFSPDKLIIVAHSISGIIGLEIANARQQRVCGFIAISAFIPIANNSFVSSLPFFTGVFLGLMLALAGTRPPVSAIRGGLCNDLNEKQSLEVINHFVPESKELYTDKLKAENVPVNSMYVHLKKDKTLSEVMQKRMIANLHTKQIVEIDSGHLPMLGKPDALAQVLNTFALQAITQNNNRDLKT